jgi:hypothetical protein
MAQSRDCIDRREFTGRALMAMLAGVTVTMTGCGSDNGAVPSPPVTDRTAVVATNHGHAVTITAAQQMAGGNVVLNIQGTSSHDHVLELTAVEVAQIRAGLQVVKGCAMMRSHTHMVTFN